MTSPEPSAADPSPPLPPPVPPPTKADKRVVRRALRRADGERSRIKGDLLVALVVGVVISTATVVVQWKLDRDAAAREESLAAQAELAAEQRDDLRFVREIASAPIGAARPFARLDLTGASLAGLPLGCTERGDVDCASFVNSTLVATNLVGTDLRGARFEGSNATDASFAWADLREATFDVSRITSASFLGADLRGSSFVGSTVAAQSSLPSFEKSDLRGTTFATEWDSMEEEFPNLDELMVSDGPGLSFDDACWDATTVWPDDFEPPPSNPESCRPN
ncbi:pentapeptide repeat-containing protein [Cellulosimicrobium terreum]|nr:pentapeptide repeat-containing protein [Cellulosimicrobium terreum]